MASVYLETTIPSYLAARPSRDLVIAAHQQVTSHWWHTARERFDVQVSEAVLAEIRVGDANAAKKRLALIRDLPVLRVNDLVRSLALQYRENLELPRKAAADVVHIAFSVAYEIDYLVTWNFKHIANGEVVRRLREKNLELRVFTPLILTPEELME
ncbi:MAG: type II toxin-antitoxin system VapC family toxin [Planctomycetota bacterium]